MKLQRDEFGIKEYPLFTQPDIEALEEHILPMQFGKTRTLIKDDEEIKITFYRIISFVGKLISGKIFRRENRADY